MRLTGLGASRAGAEVDHQILLLQPILRLTLRLPGSPDPRPGEERQLDPVRLLLLDLPGAAMEPVAPAVQAVGPWLASSVQHWPSRSRRAPPCGWQSAPPRPPAIPAGWVASSAQPSSTSTALPPPAGWGGEGWPRMRGPRSRAGPSSFFQLESHHGLRFPVVIPSPLPASRVPGRGVTRCQACVTVCRPCAGTADVAVRRGRNGPGHPPPPRRSPRPPSPGAAGRPRSRQNRRRSCAHRLRCRSGP